MSWYLIWRHATHYLKPWEQRHIIRVLFLVPIYATVSFLSYYFYKHSIYFDTIRDCYEAFAIASFFALLCHYIAPDLHNQKDYFRGLRPRPWVWPLTWFRKCCGGERGIWRTPRSGLTWFNVSGYQSAVARAACRGSKLMTGVDNLAWSIPVLLRPGLYDDSSGDNASRRALLLRIAEPCICACLGMSSLSLSPSN